MHNPWPLAFKAQFESEDETRGEVIKSTYIFHIQIEIKLQIRKHKNRFNLKTNNLISLRQGYQNIRKGITQFN